MGLCTVCGFPVIDDAARLPRQDSVLVNNVKQHIKELLNNNSQISFVYINSTFNNDVTALLTVSNFFVNPLFRQYPFHTCIVST